MEFESRLFLLNNKSITITNEIYEFDSSKIRVDRYLFLEVDGSDRELLQISDKEEFYRDVALQLNRLQGKAMTKETFFESAFLENCAQHIEKFGRLIVTDMHSYLNCTMQIIDASNKELHNLIATENDGVELRKFFCYSGMYCLTDFIWVPHPSENEGDGRAKIIPLKESVFFNSGNIFQPGYPWIR